ncbi:hypothetical protein ACIA8O_36070 [Kitasatospora sp. NPDC051853]|uniref:hypothetical protein n=1 Tax=Kitasatospora sp. NPDC051853 TaxID=3364058 RepID=UPI00379361FB
MPVTDDFETVMFRLWEERAKQRYPRARAVEPGRFDVSDLFALDVRISGCLHTWLFHRDSFGAKHLGTIRVLLPDLERALPDLAEEDNPRLWQLMVQMCRLVLDKFPPSTTSRGRS